MLWGSEEFHQDGWHESQHMYVYLKSSKVLGFIVLALFDESNKFEFCCFDAYVDVYKLSAHSGKCIGSFSTLEAAKKAVEEVLFSAK